MIKFKLNELLHELNITKNKFSVLSKIRPNTINDMCNGSTRRLEVDTLDAILECLNQLSDREITMLDLIEYKENKYEPN
jgi:DNA-binding Xre family transcriptional regulator